MLDEFLRGKGLSVDACIKAALVALCAGRTVTAINCERCHAPHLDLHEFVLRPHAVHTCASCGHKWRHAGKHVQGNPLAEFGLSTVDGELYCDCLPTIAVGVEAARYSAVCDEFPEVFDEPQG